MKVKLLIYSMLLGFAWTTVGCDTITEMISPKRKSVQEVKKTEPQKMEEVRQQEKMKKTDSVAPQQGQAEAQSMSPKTEEAPTATTEKPRQALPQQTEPSPVVPRSVASQPASAKPAVPQQAIPPQQTEPQRTETPQNEQAETVMTEEKEAETAMAEEKEAKKAAMEEAVVEAPQVKSISKPIPELSVIYFEFDKSRIQERFRADLMRNLEWIKNHPDVKIQLECHADERGTNEYNLALGERRGQSILEYLAALGANLEQFSIVSFGEERPAAINCTNEKCYEKNRRVVFARP